MTNFGDELSRDIVEEITGRRVVWARPDSADLLAIGSIIELAIKEGAKDCVVWGSGLRHHPTAELIESIESQNIEFAAVRGPQTKTGLHLPESTAIGDPGILAPILVDDGARKDYEKLLIPHFSMWASATGRQLMREAEGAGYHIVPPTLAPRRIISLVSRADAVFSSSLHGVIVADSLGVPVVQILPPHTRGKGVAEYRSENDFKYSDYSDSLGITRTSLLFNELFANRAVHARSTAEEVATDVSTRIASLSVRLAAALKSQFS